MGEKGIDERINNNMYTIHRQQCVHNTQTKNEVALEFSRRRERNGLLQERSLG